MSKLEFVENVSTLEVGRCYLVDTVKREDGVVLPIHGPLHEDAEIINFPYKHWHIDWRFISKRDYEHYFKAGGGYMMPWAWPINEDKTVFDEVVRRRMKCKRQFGEYMPAERVPWQKRLEDKYRNAKMKNFICPHKGLPCNATPVVNGVVVCRGHGLAFNVETGELIPRTKPVAA